MHRFWQYLSYCLFGLIILSIIIYAVSWKSGSILTRDCLVINRIPSKLLNEKCVELKLVSSKLFPFVNSLYTTHWSVVIVTDSGKNISVSTGRYLSIFVSEVCKINNYRYHDAHWNIDLIPMKVYKIDKDVTLYDLSLHALKFYNKNKDSSYSAINHNCHHVVQYLIKEFCKVDKDDKFIKEYRGGDMMKKCVSDVFTGSKVFV